MIMDLSTFILSKIIDEKDVVKICDFSTEVYYGPLGEVPEKYRHFIVNEIDHTHNVIWIYEADLNF